MSTQEARLAEKKMADPNSPVGLSLSMLTDHHMTAIAKVIKFRFHEICINYIHGMNLQKGIHINYNLLHRYN